MTKLNAFVARSFDKSDDVLIREFYNFFDSINQLKYEDAKKPEDSGISEKIKNKMSNKNLFIGIFTKKHKIGYLNKSWLPSLWSVQESGYAMGKDMKGIFLIEEGIGKHSEVIGLKGDYEFIPFRRNNISEAIVGFNNVIKKILGDMDGLKETITRNVEVEKSETDDSEKKVETSKILENNVIDYKSKTEKELGGELLLATLFDDQENENKILKILKSRKDSLEKNKALVIYYFERLRSGSKKYLSLIEEIANSSNDTTAYNRLGRYYFDLGIYKSAKDHFVKAIGATQNFEDILDALRYLAECMWHIGEEKQSNEEIFSWINKIKDSDSKYVSKLYGILAENAKRNDNQELYVDLLEKALDLDPLNNDFRFKVAYAYSQIGNTEMSLYHYKVKEKESPDSAVYNNLGVAYSKLNLDGMAVKYYEIAKDKYQSTLAMSNLAYLYMGKGFFVEAERMLVDARKIEKYDKRVDSAMASLNKQREEEEEKEKEILKSTKDEIAFKVRFAECLIEGNERLESYLGIWKTASFGILQASIENKKLELDGEVEEKSVGLFDSGKLVKKKIKYIIELTGKCAKYTLLKNNFEYAKGKMIFNQENTLIDCCENISGKLNFYSIKKEKSEINIPL